MYKIIMLPNLIYIEKLYRAFSDNPDSVDATWRSFFHGVELGADFKADNVNSIELLIRAYSLFGHLKARINLFDEPDEPPQLKLEHYGLSAADLDKPFGTCGVLDQEVAPLKEILSALEQRYCQNTGYELFGENAQKMAQMIKELPALKGDEQKRILHELNRAEMFENFLHMKYTGQKRFSLEGGEALIPMMLELLFSGGDQGVSSAVIGMAHRGRLNVLANVLGKPYATIYAEFDPEYVPQEGDGSGDVKYHKGYDATIKIPSGKEIALRLAANPSHLEAVNPVVEGYAYGLQQGQDSKAVLPILIHGDAAVAGQGIVYETMQLSNIEGYSTGGTIHIVINNQIGFTALPKESRSTRYCTDIAKAFDAPVIHVNGEDPDSCVQAARLAMAFRQTFGCDVFIDLNCYRKYGHNEGDEPAFTQPVMYEKIKSQEKLRISYRNALISKGVISDEIAQGMENEFKSELDAALSEVEKLKIGREYQCPVPEDKSYPDTGVEKNLLVDLGKKALCYPDSVHIQPKVKRILDERAKMLIDAPVDWGMAETLAYASVLNEGYPIRISGQDSIRGTFSHRHAAITDSQTQERYIPLQHISDAQFQIYNSPLSEYGVLLFEYGYALTKPNGLNIWEAQFGDFANGAQIAIDQFIATSEQKWREIAPLTLLLPHGYEGQGPEHSSARIERFLQLASNNSMIICNNSNTAQLFHLLRSHIHSAERHPLIIFTPKALLRYGPSLSNLDAFCSGHYQKVIDDTTAQNPKRLIFCSGKVYYDLLEAKEGADIALIRIEQLYPFPYNDIKALLAKYKGVKQVYWVQEEHQNMGAWAHVHFSLSGLCDIRYFGRPKSASPAAGFPTLHQRELKTFLKEALS